MTEPSLCFPHSLIALVSLTFCVCRACVDSMRRVRWLSTGRTWSMSTKDFLTSKPGETSFPENMWLDSECYLKYLAVHSLLIIKKTGHLAHTSRPPCTARVWMISHTQ